MPQTVAIASVEHDSQHKKRASRLKKRLSRSLFASFLPQNDANHARRPGGVYGVTAPRVRKRREKDDKKMRRFPCFVCYTCNIRQSVKRGTFPALFFFAFLLSFPCLCTARTRCTQAARVRHGPGGAPTFGAGIVGGYGFIRRAFGFALYIIRIGLRMLALNKLER